MFGCVGEREKLQLVLNKSLSSQTKYQKMDSHYRPFYKKQLQHWWGDKMLWFLFTFWCLIIASFGTFISLKPFFLIQGVNPYNLYFYLQLISLKGGEIVYWLQFMSKKSEMSQYNFNPTHIRRSKMVCWDLNFLWRRIINVTKRFWLHLPVMVVL